MVEEAQRKKAAQVCEAARKEDKERLDLPLLRRSLANKLGGVIKRVKYNGKGASV